MGQFIEPGNGKFLSAESVFGLVLSVEAVIAIARLVGWWLLSCLWSSSVVGILRCKVLGNGEGLEYIPSYGAIESFFFTLFAS